MNSMLCCVLHPQTHPSLLLGEQYPSYTTHCNNNKPTASSKKTHCRASAAHQNHQQHTHSPHPHAHVGTGGGSWTRHLRTCKAAAQAHPQTDTASLKPSRAQNSSLPGGMPAPLLTPADKAVLSCWEIVLMGAGAGLPLKGSSSANHRDSTAPETRHTSHVTPHTRDTRIAAVQERHARARTDLRGGSGRGAARRGTNGVYARQQQDT